MTDPNECDHDWGYVPDWEGDPSIPGGTIDRSHWYCPLCDSETTERPPGWEDPFMVPEYDD